MKNHIPPIGFEELLDAANEGGILMFPVREDEWVELGYKDKAESLEKEGKWKLLVRETKGNFMKSGVTKNYVYSLYLKL